MTTINRVQGYAFAKKKGDTIHVFEGAAYAGGDAHGAEEDSLCW